MVKAVNQIFSVFDRKFFDKTSLDKGGKLRSYSKREGRFFGGPLIVEVGVLNQFSPTSFE